METNRIVLDLPKFSLLQDFLLLTQPLTNFPESKTISFCSSEPFRMLCTQIFKLAAKIDWASDRSVFLEKTKKVTLVQTFEICYQEWHQAMRELIFFLAQNPADRETLCAKLEFNKKLKNARCETHSLDFSWRLFYNNKIKIVDLNEGGYPPSDEDDNLPIHKKRRITCEDSSSSSEDEEETTNRRRSNRQPQRIYPCGSYSSDEDGNISTTRRRRNGEQECFEACASSEHNHKIRDIDVYKRISLDQKKSSSKLFAHSLFDLQFAFWNLINFFLMKKEPLQKFATRWKEWLLEYGFVAKSLHGMEKEEGSQEIIIPREDVASCLRIWLHPQFYQSYNIKDYYIFWNLKLYLRLWSAFESQRSQKPKKYLVDNHNLETNLGLKTFATNLYSLPIANPKKDDQLTKPSKQNDLIWSYLCFYVKHTSKKQNPPSFWISSILEPFRTQPLFLHVCLLRFQDIFSLWPNSSMKSESSQALFFQYTLDWLADNERASVIQFTVAKEQEHLEVEKQKQKERKEEKSKSWNQIHPQLSVFLNTCPFLFPMSKIQSFNTFLSPQGTNWIRTKKKAFASLTRFLGERLFEALDLSQSVLTGSSLLPACSSQIEAAGKSNKIPNRFHSFIEEELYFPRAYTTLCKKSKLNSKIMAQVNSKRKELLETNWQKISCASSLDLNKNAYMQLVLTGKNLRWEQKGANLILSSEIGQEVKSPTKKTEAECKKFQTREANSRVHPFFTNRKREKLQKLHCKLVPGSDIDILVWNDIDFQQIAQQHIKTILRLFPQYRVKVEEKKNLQTKKEENSTDQPKKYLLYDPNFYLRPIQIYLAPLHNIFSHHCAPVRAFCAGNGKERDIYLSASCLHSLYTRKVTFCNRFSGKKTPCEILFWMQLRGWKIEFEEARFVQAWWNRNPFSLEKSHKHFSKNFGCFPLPALESLKMGHDVRHLFLESQLLMQEVGLQKWKELPHKCSKLSKLPKTEDEAEVMARVTRIREIRQELKDFGNSLGPDQEKYQYFLRVPFKVDFDLDWLAEKTQECHSNLFFRNFFPLQPLKNQQKKRKDEAKNGNLSIKEMLNQALFESLT